MSVSNSEPNQQFPHFGSGQSAIQKTEGQMLHVRVSFFLSAGMGDEGMGERRGERGGGRERMRERERKGKTEREGERGRRETHRETDRQTETPRDRDRETYLSLIHI